MGKTGNINVSVFPPVSGYDWPGGGVEEEKVHQFRLSQYTGTQEQRQSFDVAFEVLIWERKF